MKSSTHSFLLSLAMSTGRALAQTTTIIEQNLQECIQDGQFEIGVDYFPEKYTPREFYPIFFPSDQASLDNTTDYLEIEYFDYYKIVTNKYHNKSYLLYQCGAEPPIDEVRSGDHHLILPVPHKGGVAVTETPQIPPLELLGLRREIIAYIGDPQYISSPCLNYLIDAGSVEIVFDPDDPGNATQLQVLTDGFLERNADAVIFGGIFADPDGDRLIGIANSQERTNVATFDWIALYAALYNLEALSNKIAEDTKERYICSASNAQSLSSDIQEEERTLILWAYYYDGFNWSIAECPTWDHTYYCEYAAHCGANIISRPEGFGWDNGFGSFSVDDEQLLSLGKDADVFIFPSPNWETTYSQKKELLDQFKSVQNQQVYDTQGGGPNAWFEQRLAEYDVVANDFCAVIGLSNPLQIPPHTVKWFRNVYNGTVPLPGTCNVPDELDERYVPVGAFCEPLDQLPGPDEDDQTGGQSLPPTTDAPSGSDGTSDAANVQASMCATSVLSSLVFASLQGF